MCLRSAFVLWRVGTARHIALDAATTASQASRFDSGSATECLRHLDGGVPVKWLT